MDHKILKGPQIKWKIPHKPIGKVFLEALSRHERDKKAVVNIVSGEFYTYGQLLEFSQNLASSLRDMGIGKDDVIAIALENSHKFLVVYLAGLYLAAPMHLIDPGYTEYEIRHLLNLSKPKLVICSKKALKHVTTIREEVDFIQMTVLTDGDDESSEVCLYKNLIETPKTPFQIEEKFDFDDHVAVIFNSSGTTGLPKRVLITLGNSYCM